MNLFNRRLGTSEEIHISGLAEELDLDESVVNMQLKEVVRLPIHSRNGAPFIVVPDSALIRQKLIDEGVDEDVLQPRKAMRGGKMCAVKWIEKVLMSDEALPKQMRGCVRFKVTWEGKAAPSRVCCHALNAASRYHVSVLLCSFDELRIRCRSNMIFVFIFHRLLMPLALKVSPMLNL